MFDYVHPHDGPVVEGLEKQEVVYAEDQPEYIPLRTLRGDGIMVPVISRWTPTPEQRKAIAEGADIFLELSTFGNPLQPIRIAVSDSTGSSFADWFKVCILNQRIVLRELVTQPQPTAEEQQTSSDEKFLKDVGVKA